MLRVETRGIEQVKTFLHGLPRGAISIVIPAIAEYLMGGKSGEGGEATHGLKRYPAYRHVTMRQAYGGFVSDKQRRYVMAMIREGKITPGYPKRTGELQRGWRIKGEMYRQVIYNATPYARWVMGDSQQARLPALGGWRKMGDIIASNLTGALRHARAELGKWLRRRRAY